MNIVVLITTKNTKEANKISKALVAQKLIACANIIKGVTSLFWWQGKVDKANETLLIIKTKRNCFKKIVSLVKRLHSYDVPEIIALPIIDGNKDYLGWIDESVR